MTRLISPPRGWLCALFSSVLIACCGCGDAFREVQKKVASVIGGAVGEERADEVQTESTASSTSGNDEPAAATSATGSQPTEEHRPAPVVQPPSPPSLQPRPQQKPGPKKKPAPKKSRYSLPPPQPQPPVSTTATTGRETAAFKTGSEWVNSERKLYFKVIERNDGRFRARFEGLGSIRLIQGTINGRTVRWSARDVTVEKGKPGSDTTGTVYGNSLTLSIGPISFELKLKGTEPPPIAYKPFPGQPDAGSKSRPNVPEPVRTGPLRDEEVTLLKLTGYWHYHNEVRKTGDGSATFPKLVALAHPEARSSRMGRLILWSDVLATQQANLSADKARLYGSFEGEIYKVGLEGCLAGLGLRPSEYPSLAEFARGPGASAGRWLDNLRSNDTMRALCGVISAQLSINLANTVEEEFAARLGKDEFPSSAWKLSGLTYDEVDANRIRRENGGKIPPHERLTIGKFARIEYQGKQTLHQVIILTRLATTGPTATLSPGQQETLDLNALSGFPEKVPLIREWMMAHNMVRTMPKGGFYYIDLVQPGDVLHVPIGDADRECILGGRVKIFAKEGRLPEQSLDFETSRPK